MTKPPESLSIDPSTSPIDEAFLESFYEDFNQDSNFIAELIERFLLSAPNRLKAVQAAIERQDSKALRFEAHSLKNISMNIGGRRFSEIAFKLEKAGECESHSEAQENLSGPLQSEYTLLEDALKKKVQSLRDPH